MTVECANADCKTKQVVHVIARTGFLQVSHQTVACVKCGRIFEVLLPDAIIDGPFPTGN